MASEIKAKYSAVPEKQVSPGIYIKSVGRKYITLLNTWGTTRLEKIDISEFYEDYLTKH